MDGWPKIQLVATPDVGATVLYDFNVDPRRRSTSHEGFDLGAPDWPGRPGQQGGVEGYRTIRFTHYLDAKDATAAGVALSALGQRLTVPFNWLLIQQRAGVTPTWAKVWRSTPGALSWNDVQSDAAAAGRYSVEVSFTADPYLVGASITLANAVTVNNDPASGTNPNRYSLATVIGDAPVPAIVTATPNTAQDGSLRLLGITAGAATATVWQVGTGDGWTVGNYAAATTDAAWSGGSYRATTLGSGGATPNRGTLSTSKTMQPGRYYMLVRAGQAAAATSTFQFTFYAGPLGLSTVSDTWTVAAGTGAAQWHPVGLVTFPQGAAQSVAYLAAEPTISASVQLNVDRISGTNQINVDAIALIPVPDGTATLSYAVFTAGDFSITADIVDSEQELVYARNTSTNVLMTRPAISFGGFPVLTPGANVLHLYGALVGSSASASSAGAGTTSRGDTITTSHTVTVKYRPRWFWPRP